MQSREEGEKKEKEVGEGREECKGVRERRIGRWKKKREIRDIREEGRGGRESGRRGISK